MASHNPKKHYTAPRLKTYGDIRALTQATTKGGTSADGGSKPQTRATGPQSG